jgi:sporulation protein YlmC with PRC-barrel domain
MVLRHVMLAAVIGSLAATANAQTPPPPPASPAHTTGATMPAPGASDAANLIGRSVTNSHNETIGKVESVYLSSTGKVDSLIVAVGGFLGVGQRYARLNWKDLQVSDNGDKVVLNMSKDQLKAMAPYKYKDDAVRGHVFNDRGPWKDDSRAAADARATTDTAVAGNRDRAMADNRADKGAFMGTESTGDFNAKGDLSFNALVGTKVKNDNKDTVGSIEDVYLDGSGQIQTVVLSVGGFLGLGAKDVAVKWSDLKQGRDGKSVVITTNLSKDDLKALPDYKYQRRQPDQAASPDHPASMNR